VKPTDRALRQARRLRPREQQAVRDAFEQTPPTDPIWLERGYWPNVTPVELDYALKWLAERAALKYSAVG